MTPERLAAGEAFERRLQRDAAGAAPVALARRRVGRLVERAGSLGDELLEIVHDLRRAARRGVELEHGEFGVVRARRLAVAEDARQLVTARIPAPRQQPLHGVLGAGHEMKSACALELGRRVGREDRFERAEVRLLAGERDGDGRLGLQISAPLQAIAHRAREPRAGAGHVSVGGHLRLCNNPTEQEKPLRTARRK